LNNAGVVGKCLAVLRNIATSSETKNENLRSGGIELIFSSLKSFPTSDFVQYCGLMALYNIVSAGDACKEKIYQLGGFDLITTTFNNFPTSEGALRFLFNLTVNVPENHQRCWRIIISL